MLRARLCPAGAPRTGRAPASLRRAAAQVLVIGALAASSCGGGEREAGPDGAEGLGGASSAMSEREKARPPGDGARPIDLAAVMKRAHFAFREAPPFFLGGHSTYRVRVEPSGGFTVAAVAQGKTATAVRFETRSVAAGGRARRDSTHHVERAEAGSLRIRRGGVDEHLAATVEGLEQTWRLSRAPEPAGDLVVRVGVEAASFAGSTATGLHFRDPATGLGLRYGHATWVDAEGARTHVPVRFEGGDVVIEVPGAVVARSRFPAVLDPIIGPEVAVDTPPVGLAAGTQRSPALAYGGGQYLAVWADDRTAVGDGFDLYGARISEAGAVLDPDGFPICFAKGDQDAPAVAFDGTNYAVVWQDARFGDDWGKNWGIYLARIGKDGVVQDKDPNPNKWGIALCPALGDQTSPSITYGGSGQYLAAWDDTRDGDLTTYAARFGTDGAIDDPEGLAVGQGKGPAVASDGAKYFLSHLSPDASNLILYQVPFVGPHGQLASFGDGPFSVPLSMAHGGGKLFVTWAQGSSVHALRVDGGTVKLTGPAAVASPRVAWNGENFLFAWADLRNGTWDVYGARVTKASTVLDPMGILIAGGTAQAEHPAVASNGAGQSLVSWETGAEVAAARVDAAGVVEDPAGVVVSTHVAAEVAPAVAFDGTSYFVAWEDDRSDVADILGVRVDPTGKVLDAVPAAVSSVEGVVEAAPAAAHGGGKYLLTWPSGDCRFVDGAGKPSGNAVPCMTGGDPAVAFDGSSFLVVSTLGDGFSLSDIQARRVEPNGAVVDPVPISVSAAIYLQRSPAVAFGGNAYLVVWEDSRAGGGEIDVYGARVSPDGTVLDVDGILISGAPNAQTSPSVAFDGTQFFVVWQDARGGTKDIYGARVTPDGTVLDPNGIAVSSAPGAQRVPWVAYTGDASTFFVAWEDDRNASAQIYGAWVSTSGTVLDPAGVALAADPLGSHAPSGAAAGAGKVLLAYQRVDPTTGVPAVRVRILASGSVLGAPCAKDDACASRHCTDGVCCAEACTSPCQTCKQVPGTCQGVLGGEDLGACDGAQTCDANGACKLKDGQACPGGAAACASGHCADGVCCDAACTGACDRCDAPKAGTCAPVPAGEAGSPSCVPYVCTGAAVCPSACTSDAGCATNAYCAADGKCKARKKEGAPCDDAAFSDCLEQGCRVCETDYCADGVCCDGACDGPCNACAGAGVPVAGTCSLLPAGAPGSPDCAPFVCTGASVACGSGCASDAQCAAGAHCNQAKGVCEGDGIDGAACAKGGECGSGHCVDGMCCATACDDPCQACAAGEKQSGVGDGQCGFAKAGTDPHDDCEDLGAPACKDNGLCNGAGACQVYGSEDACGAPTCENNAVKDQVCLGAGVCGTKDAGADCGLFVCKAGACADPCVETGDCVEWAFCDEGVCVQKLDEGQACEHAEQCESGFCADGFCCGSDCDGQCEACDADGKHGQCVPVVGDPHGERGVCGGEGACKGACDGENRAACAFKAVSKICATSCEGGVQTMSQCDGSGSCVETDTAPCDPYVCDGDVACKQACDDDEDCAPGYGCIEDECRPLGATCKDGHISKGSDGTVKDCSPYGCDASGRCRESCTSVDDCLSPNLCDEAGRCVPAPSEEETLDIGCGCRVAGSRGDASAAAVVRLFALLGAAAMGARRRGRRAFGRSSSRTSARNMSSCRGAE